MRKNFIILTILVILLKVIGHPTFAELGRVKVNIPDHEVTINGVSIDSEFREYPILKYENITYFPLTYYDCRFLGLESKWTDENRLIVKKTGVFGEYRDYLSTKINNHADVAEIPVFDVVIDGEKVSNSDQKYPLLSFRNITYFPITWSYAVEMFGWSYEYDTSKGLSITTNGVYVERVELPNEVKTINAVNVFDEYYYYVGEENGEGYLYRTPINDVTKETKVYKLLGHDAYHDGKYSTSVELFEKAEQLYFKHEAGGANFGKRVICKIDDSGVVEDFISGRSDFELYKNTKIIQTYSSPPSANNMYSTEQGSTDRKYLGDPRYVYENLIVIDDWIFTIGYLPTDNLRKIFKINLLTDEVAMLTNTSASNMTFNKYIYFIGLDDGKLHMIDVNTAAEEIVIEDKISDYCVAENAIYYITDNNRLMKQQDTGVIENALTDLYFYKIEYQENYLLLYYHEEITEDRGLIVLDENDNTIFKTSDWVVESIVENGILYYKTLETMTNYKVRLDGVR